MAARKKTTVEELKELIDATPKARILTDEQLQILVEIYDKLTDIRRGLGQLEGEENVSTIMFKIGSVHNNADWCEDAVRDIVNSFDEDYDDCDECGNDF
jgi:hypothetical protein